MISSSFPSLQGGAYSGPSVELGATMAMVVAIAIQISDSFYIYSSLNLSSLVTATHSSSAL